MNAQLRKQPIAQAISQTFPKKISAVLGKKMIHQSKNIPGGRISEFPVGYYDYIGAVELGNRRAVPMTTAINAGVDLSKFESDYHYSANFDMLFVERGSRLDVWLYLSL